MVGMFNYCFRVSDYVLVFFMIFVSRFGRCSVRNVVTGYYVRGMGSRHLEMCRFSLSF